MSVIARFCLNWHKAELSPYMATLGDSFGGYHKIKCQSNKELTSHH